MTKRQIETCQDFLNKDNFVECYIRKVINSDKYELKMKRTNKKDQRFNDFVVLELVPSDGTV